jgi:hypothetical protein
MYELLIYDKNKVEHLHYLNLTSFQANFLKELIEKYDIFYQKPILTFTKTCKNKTYEILSNEKDNSIFYTILIDKNEKVNCLKMGESTLDIYYWLEIKYYVDWHVRFWMI